MMWDFSHLLDIYGHILADIQLGLTLGIILHIAVPGCGRPV